MRINSGWKKNYIFFNKRTVESTLIQVQNFRHSLLEVNHAPRSVDRYRFEVVQPII